MSRSIALLALLAMLAAHCAHGDAPSPSSGVTLQHVHKDASEPLSQTQCKRSKGKYCWAYDKCWKHKCSDGWDNVCQDGYKWQHRPYPGCVPDPGSSGSDLVRTLQYTFDAGKTTMFGIQGGISGKEDMKWENAEVYFFKKEVTPQSDPSDINSDGQFSDIGYSTMLRKDTLNTYFSNDGLTGHTGYAGIVFKEAAWNPDLPYSSTRMTLRQGWMIDSWPDFRFNAPAGTGPKNVTNFDRFSGLQKPPGYRTAINYGYYVYTANADDPPEVIYEEATKVPLPPFIKGDNGQYISFEYDLQKTNPEAFLAYYRGTMDSTMGGTDGYKYEGVPGNSPMVPDPDRASGKTVTFFQGYVDLLAVGVVKGLDKVAELRNLYFRNRLWANSPTGGPPMGSEVEIDIAPYKTEPILGDKNGAFMSYVVPYDAVAAAALFHDGPKWTLATRPQPPHTSTNPNLTADPEFYSIYGMANVIRDGIANETKQPRVPLIEISTHVWGTHFALDQFEAIIKDWANSPPPKGRDVITQFVDFYRDTSAPGCKVVPAREAYKTPVNSNELLRVLPPLDNWPLSLDLSKSRIQSAYGAWVEGGVGSDKLVGSPGSDDLYGGPGNDMLTAYSSTDRLTGGPGLDEFRIQLNPYPYNRKSSNTRHYDGHSNATPTVAIVTDMEQGEKLVVIGATGPLTLRQMYWPGIKPSGTIYEFRGDGYTAVLVGGREVAQVWRATPADLVVQGTTVTRK